MNQNFFQNHLKFNSFWIVLACFFIFLFKIYSLIFPYYPIDIPVNVAWCEFLAKHRFRDFYDHFHVVYGPLNLYFFWMLGWSQNFLGMDTTYLVVALRLFAMVGDFIAALLLYKYLNNLHLSLKLLGIQAKYFSCLWPCLPGIYFNSGIWGQFDGWLCAWIFLFLYAFCFLKIRYSFFFYTVALLSKPQMLMLAPCFIWYLLYSLWLKPKNIFKEFLIGIVFSFLTLFLLLYPFYNPWEKSDLKSLEAIFSGFKNLILWLPSQYLGKVEDYPYLSANAFNFWFAVGKQTFPDAHWFWNPWISYKNLSIFIVLILSLLIFVKSHSYFKKITNPQNINITVLKILETFYLQISLCFIFLSRMHERYALYVLVPLSILFIAKPAKHWLSFLFWNLIIFSNHYYVYHKSFQSIYWLDPRDWLGVFMGILATLILTKDLVMNLKS